MARRRSMLLAAGVATAALAGCSTGAGANLSTTGTSNAVWETLPPTSTTATPGSAPAAAGASSVTTTKPLAKQPNATTTTTFRFVTPTYTTRTTTVATTTTVAAPTTTVVSGPCPVASDLTAGVDRWTTYYQDGGTTKQGRPYGKWTVTLYGHVSNSSAVQVSVDAFGIDATPPEELMRTVRLMVANVPPGGSRSWVTQYTYPSYATGPDGTAYANGDWTHTVGIFDWSPMVACG